MAILGLVRTIDAASEGKLRKLVICISTELKQSKKNIFAKEPSAHVFCVNNAKFLVSLFDEQKSGIEFIEGKKPERGVINFFISRFIMDEFFSEESNIITFAKSKIDSYIEDLREDVAYSANLKRVQSLYNESQFFAAIVFAASAFETATKDTLFNNNSFWFDRLDKPSDKVLNRCGTKLTRTEEKQIDVFAYYEKDNEKWAFDKNHYNTFTAWRKVEYKSKVFQICKDLGVLQEYLLKLYANQLREIGSYELLKETLMNKGSRSAINFQMIDGECGIK